MIFLDNSYWEVRNTKDKGQGLFAKKLIKKGTVIGDYLGKVIHPQDAVVDEDNFYLMYYHDKAVIVPDLEKPGVHLLNHSCLPNSFIYIYRGHTLAFALRNILKGEELTINYLLAPKDGYCDPCEHDCCCGSYNCTGTMHLSKEKFDLWRKIYDKESKKTKRERIKYRKDLLPLAFYPKIPESYIKEVEKSFNPSSSLNV